jgi:hypothetical protein
MAVGQTTYRVTLLLLGTAFILVVIGTVLLAPSGSGEGLPDPVQRVSPADGELVLSQTRIILQLEPGYRASLIVDDVPVPADQVIFTVETGLHVFTPGPGLVVEEWSPGIHVVEASWERLSGLPDPGSMRWSFRVA